MDFVPPYLPKPGHTWGYMAGGGGHMGGAECIYSFKRFYYISITFAVFRCVGGISTLAISNAQRTETHSICARCSNPIICRIFGAMPT